LGAAGNEVFEVGRREHQALVLLAAADIDAANVAGLSMSA
jgi:hypothetical protein